MLVVEVVTNTVILIVTFVMFARWKRIKKMGFLEKLNLHVPFPLIPVFVSNLWVFNVDFDF